MKKTYLLVAIIFSSQLLAKTLSPVVELDVSSDSDTQNGLGASNIQLAEQFYQMQVLKDEVKMLHGKVDELSYQLQELKQLQMDDYLDVDRRLTAISRLKPIIHQRNNSVENIIGSPDFQNASHDTQTIESLAPIIITPEDIEADYAASSKLLKERDFDGAIAAFKNHIFSFKQSPYTANAYYWLGEIYEFRGEAQLAVESFEVVISDYSDHNKAMDARYKLGKLYHKQGNTKRAVELLQEAAQSNGGAGAKANAYLKAKGL